MSENGLQFGGLLRSLQGDLLAIIGVLVVILGLGFFVRWLIGLAVEAGELEPDATKVARSWTTRLCLVLSLIVLAFFGWRAISMTAANRVPRSDVDKSDVYDQMKSHQPANK